MDEASDQFSRIIDEEEDARVILRSFLESHCPQIEIIGEADSVQSGIELIRSASPELVFLDVRMSSGTGFDVLEGVGEVNFQTIFVTAHDKYAVRAIRVSALDFLLKPVDIDELVAAVEKVSTEEPSATEDIRYQVIKKELAQPAGQTGRMVLPTQEGLQVVSTESIVCCEADRNYTIFWFNNGKKALIPKTLKFYEELLSPAGFFRIHQSHLVNLSYIVEYKRRKKGGIIFLKDRMELPIAESRKMNFQQMFLR